MPAQPASRVPDEAHQPPDERLWCTRCNTDKHLLVNSIRFFIQANPCELFPASIARNLREFIIGRRPGRDRQTGKRASLGR